MKGPTNAKLIVFHPSLHKGGGGGSSLVSIHRLWLIAFVSFSVLASLLLTLLSCHPAHRLPPHPAMSSSSSSSSSFSGGGGPPAALPPVALDALVHYAASAAGNGSGGGMAEADLRAAAGVVRRRAPCNLLVFGLGAETPLWRALNAGGRTVFLDENEYYVSQLESRQPGLEAYDVAFAAYARARDLRRLLSAARAAHAAECRPVQDLLFSDCPLALNDLPNHLYDVAWDVILVDGPRGNDPAAPGRMAPIFTAAVMARSARDAAPADVLVHDYDRDVERLCAQEFLCDENRAAVTSTPTLAHFVIRPAADADAGAHAFCANSTFSSSPAAAAAAASSSSSSSS